MTKKFVNKNVITKNSVMTKNSNWEIFKLVSAIFKSSFRSRDIQFFVLFPFLSTLSRLKRTNGSGIIYDVINWLA